MTHDISKHTPGPWIINWSGRRKDGKIVHDECYVSAPGTGVDDVSVAADIADPLTGKTSIANARLIAAAPDLLDGARDFIAFRAAMANEDDLNAMLLYASASKKLAEAFAKATVGQS